MEGYISYIRYKEKACDKVSYNGEFAKGVLYDNKYVFLTGYILSAEKIPANFKLMVARTATRANDVTIQVRDLDSLKQHSISYDETNNGIWTPQSGSRTDIPGSTIKRIYTFQIKPVFPPGYANPYIDTITSGFSINNVEYGSSGRYIIINNESEVYYDYINNNIVAKLMIQDDTSNGIDNWNFEITTYNITLYYYYNLLNDNSKASIWYLDELLYKAAPIEDNDIIEYTISGNQSPVEGNITPEIEGSVWREKTVYFDLSDEHVNFVEWWKGNLSSPEEHSSSTESTSVKIYHGQTIDYRWDADTGYLGGQSSIRYSEIQGTNYTIRLVAVRDYYTVYIEPAGGTTITASYLTGNSINRVHETFSTSGSINVLGGTTADFYVDYTGSKNENYEYRASIDHRSVSSSSTVKSSAERREIITNSVTLSYKNTMTYYRNADKGAGYLGTAGIRCGDLSEWDKERTLTIFNEKTIPHYNSNFMQQAYQAGSVWWYVEIWISGDLSEGMSVIVSFDYTITKAKYGNWEVI